MRRATLAAVLLTTVAIAATETGQRAAARGTDTKRPPVRRQAGDRERSTATAARRIAVRELPTQGEITRRARYYRAKTWHWQSVLGKRRWPSVESKRQAANSRADQLRLLRLWRGRAARIWLQARRPPHKREWLCIHRYEGAWNDPGAPYYGGLQMDLDFQRTYGAYLLRKKGTANRWSPLEQMWVAERAYKQRGFHPWPTAARFCGLI